ncbi:MAG: hypothetical protein K2X82_15690 [Gemmataceae bacterium]|nr:hypothetical protein [Gemmataceae bacterium]
MRIYRPAAAVATAGACVLLPGCLTLFSKTEVVRAEETRRPVRFENAQAAETFNKALKDKDNDGNLGGACFGVPFVTLYARQKKLGDNARFNDAVGRCDTDQDGLITGHEADIFAKVCGCD